MTVSNVAVGNAPVPFTTQLGNMVSLQQGMQDLQKGSISLQAQQQANQERQNVIQLTQNDPDFKPGPDGIVDMSKVMPKLMQAAPQTYAQYAQNLNTVNNGAANTNGTLIALGGDRLNAMSDVATSVNHPGVTASEVIDTMTDYKKANPQSAGVIDQFLARVPGMNEEQLRGALSHISLRSKTLAEQQAAQNAGATPVNSGGQTQFVATPGNINGTAPGTKLGVPITNTITPGEREKLVTDPVSGQTVIAHLDDNGNIVSSRAAAGGQGNGTGRPNTGFQAIPPGESVASGQQFQSIREQSNAAVQPARTASFNNKQILGLLNSGTTTGQGAETAKKVFGSLGLEWSNDEGKNLATMQHYLAQNQIAAEQTMGVRHTDAGGQEAGAVTGNISIPTEALKGIVKTNDAFSTAIPLYNQGMEAAIKKGGSVYAIRQFRNEWSQNFDPNVFRYQNAIRNGDAAEKAAIERRSDFPQIMQHAAVLHNLITNGAAQ